ncbi:hypothetical protein Aoki45_04370 [Algoriphagus sp. oki45]|nr:hypothetical protein Aoki45_04370 [Algoriphagus sp. oki45]
MSVYCRLWTVDYNRMQTTLLIKNMVCPRCIEAVSEIFSGERLEAKVELGKVRLEKSISEEQKEKLAQLLQNRGFELLESGKSALISQIKTGIIDLVHHQDNHLHENLSTYLSEKLNHEYSGLSKLFSQVEGITIERFYTLQKIEKVKEYLFYDELSLSEIAFQMGYSSVAYLSAQFKKETGMTPSEFKKNGLAKRRSLDGI